MNIREKLALLRKTEQKVLQKHRTSRDKSVSKTGEKLDLPGFIIESTPGGDVFFRDNFFPLDHRHGDIFLREMLDVPSEVLVFLGQDPIFKNLNLNRTLFIDTETTGLAGGTGTKAFIVGIGFAEGSQFIVRQYFMPDYKHEPAMLSHFNEFLKDYVAIVSFNGRVFDVPLIKTRLIMNRISPGRWDDVHLDLLHPARRFWKNTLSSCSLSSLERGVLGVHRENDVPGYLIPGIYFDYIRHGDFSTIEKVLQHNLLDILSLSTLITRMWMHLEYAACGQLKSSEFYSLGKMFQNKKNLSESAKFYKKSLDCEAGGWIKFKAMRNLAAIFKKRRMWDEAVRLWKQICEESEIEVKAAIELAKYYEHQMQDYATAYKYASIALEAVGRRSSMGIAPVTVTGRRRESILHRINRLEKKINLDG